MHGELLANKRHDLLRPRAIGCPMLFERKILKYLSQTIFIVLFVLGTIHPSAWAQMNTCAMAEMIQNELKEKKAERKSLHEIQQEKMKAQRIKEGLVNSDSEREILLLAESIQKEIDQLKKDQNTNYVTGGLSVGSIVMASYFIKRMSSTNAGLSFKRKFLRQLNPTGTGAGLRTLTNSVFFIGTVSTMYIFYKVNQNQDQMKVLSDMIDQLDKIRDFSNQVQSLDEHIEEMQVSFEIMLDQVLSEEAGEWKNQELFCF